MHDSMREMKIRKLFEHNSERLSSWLLSEDMMTEIFLWLPLKSLIRFKRLSKRWYFLISHKDSYFRGNYLSTLSTRRRNRIVGGGSSDDSAIMAGFFYQKHEYWRSYDRVRFLPTSRATTTSTQFKKYSFLPDSQLQNYNNNIRQGGQEGQGTTTTTPGIEINPFLSLDESLDKFLSCCLHRDQDSAAAAHKKIFVAASSNGFLLCSLEFFSPETYYLVNPVTMEWVPLPKPQTIMSLESRVYVGFVCKGDYPSLDMVEYTIVRLSWLVGHEKLVFQFFSSASGDDDDNQWREYICECGSLVRFTVIRRQNPLIVSTATNFDDDDQASSSTGSPGLLVYFLVMLQPSMAIAILVFDLNRGDNSLQMIETPGPDRGSSVLQCADYIRQFDDGGAAGGGVFHYVRICCSTDFEFWVLNTKAKEWCLKHRASLKTMIEGYHTWMDIRKWNGAGIQRPPNEVFALYHIHAFHPVNPSLIFLTYMAGWCATMSKPERWNWFMILPHKICWMITITMFINGLVGLHSYDHY